MEIFFIKDGFLCSYFLLIHCNFELLEALLAYFKRIVGLVKKLIVLVNVEIFLIIKSILQQSDFFIHLVFEKLPTIPKNVCLFLKRGLQSPTRFLVLQKPFEVFKASEA